MQHHIGVVDGQWRDRFDDPTGIGLVAMQENMNVNSWSYVALASYALPVLMESNGSIGVVSSLAGKFGIPQMAVYNMCKHAINGYFAGLRSELAMLQRDVSITIHTLGSIDTEGARVCVCNFYRSLHIITPPPFFCTRSLFNISPPFCVLNRSALRTFSTWNLLPVCGLPHPTRRNRL